MKRSLVGLALVAGLAIAGPVLAADPPDEPRQPFIPCEWYPVDDAHPEGEWWQPLPAEECEAPYQNAPRVDPIATIPPAETAPPAAPRATPRMTLPPTDTAP